jgi:predicted aspartyl protease
MFKYDLTKRFPAPYMDVRIINPTLNVSRMHRGKIDTGADLTVIPIFIVEELSLPPRGTVMIKSFRHDEMPTHHPFFFVDIELANYSFRNVKVIGTIRPDILIGRNILNRVKLVLDGKNFEFEILDPPS